MSKRLADLEDLKLERWIRKRNAGEIYWQTRNGDCIPVKDMTDEHLERTINMIERQAFREWECYEALGSIGDLEI